MNDDPVRATEVVDTTDCFEVVSVFRVWRNVFFSVAVACLVLVQSIFWLVDTGVIGPPTQTKLTKPGTIQDQATPAVTLPLDDNSPTSGADRPLVKCRLRGISCEDVGRLIQMANGVLLLAAMLYWLTQLFTLAISIIGRLGGMNHICRAFFLSLIVLVLLIPWQHVLDSILLGATFSAQELANGFATNTAGLYDRAAYYLRFSGYPLAVLTLLILAHLRSVRWARAIFRRMEII